MLSRRALYRRRETDYSPAVNWSRSARRRWRHPLLMGLLALALLVRVGPFCDVAVAAAPVAHGAEAGCHDSAPPRKAHPASDLSCAAPCVAMMVNDVQPLSVAPLANLASPAPCRGMAGIALPPEAPPPRAG